MIYSEGLSVLNLLLTAVVENRWQIEGLRIANEETRQLLKGLMEPKH
jgi:hypothetical protein